MRETTELLPESREQEEEGGILEFSGEWRFLSNFHPSPLEFEGLGFPTVEHAFQAAKTLDFTAREGVAKETTPGRAKRAGRRLGLRPDWEQVKFGVMKTLVTAKFVCHPDLARQLLSTGDRQLVETNAWNDVCWGVCNGVGENHLGRILMEVRTQIRELEVIFDQ